MGMKKDASFWDRRIKKDPALWDRRIRSDPAFWDRRIRSDPAFWDRRIRLDPVFSIPEDIDSNERRKFWDRQVKYLIEMAKQKAQDGEKTKKDSEFWIAECRKKILESPRNTICCD